MITTLTFQTKLHFTENSVFVTFPYIKHLGTFPAQRSLRKLGHNFVIKPLFTVFSPVWTGLVLMEEVR